MTFSVFGDWLRLFGAVLLVVLVFFGTISCVDGLLRLASSYSAPRCYRSTMGNPDQVVQIDGAPFACTNGLRGYRCVKMEECHP